MKRTSATAMIVVTLAIGAVAGYVAVRQDDAVNGMHGIGGRDVYRAQRAEHLRRLRAEAEANLTDPAVRAAELDAIDKATGEIERYEVDELGAELKVVK